jgi:hypothetical protein
VMKQEGLLQLFKRYDAKRTFKKIEDATTPSVPYQPSMFSFFSPPSCRTSLYR